MLEKLCVLELILTLNYVSLCLQQTLQQILQQTWNLFAFYFLYLDNENKLSLSYLFA